MIKGVGPFYFYSPARFLSGNIKSYNVNFPLLFSLTPIGISDFITRSREPLCIYGCLNHISYL